MIYDIYLLSLLKDFLYVLVYPKFESLYMIRSSSWPDIDFESIMTVD